MKKFAWKQNTKVNLPYLCHFVAPIANIQHDCITILHMMTVAMRLNKVNNTDMYRSHTRHRLLLCNLKNSHKIHITDVGIIVFFKNMQTVITCEMSTG